MPRRALLPHPPDRTPSLSPEPGMTVFIVMVSVCIVLIDLIQGVINTGSMSGGRKSGSEERKTLDTKLVFLNSGMRGMTNQGMIGERPNTGGGMTIGGGKTIGGEKIIEVVEWREIEEAQKEDTGER